MSETADQDRGLAIWSNEKGHVDELLYMARNLEKVYQHVENIAVGGRIKADEHPLLILSGSRVVELRAGGGVGRDDRRVIDYRTSNGSSYPDRFHHDSFVSEPGAQRVIEPDGTITITTHRILFSSPTWNRVWEYAQTDEVFHADSVGQGWGASFVSVANRKKTSGFMYRSGFARSVRDRLVLALAVADGTLEDMVLALKAEKAELDRA
ncbi:MAG TPA: hypothetical protein VNT92_11660 [Acidimicrobiia bacterium]|nr:hypothetical protein [Acidimicrobiia bacterium]